MTAIGGVFKRGRFDLPKGNRPKTHWLGGLLLLIQIPSLDTTNGLCIKKHKFLGWESYTTNSLFGWETGGFSGHQFLPSSLFALLRSASPGLRAHHGPRLCQASLHQVPPGRPGGELCCFET